MNNSSDGVAKLIIASSDKDADLYYATRFIAPDPFVFVRTQGKNHLLLSDLEIDRAKKEAMPSVIHSVSELFRGYKKHHAKTCDFARLIVYFLKRLHVESVIVPANFPVQYYVPLKQNGFRVQYKIGLFFEERLIKCPSEIDAIKQSLRATEKSAKIAIAALKKSKIKKNKLYLNNKPLTSEALKQIIHRSLLDDNCSAEQTIVACGQQTVDPHNQGSGPLLAHHPIIMDIFPRNNKTLYYADFTRTVVRGEASPELRRLYRTVRLGQDVAFKLIKHGVQTKKVHNAVCELFDSYGFSTGVQDGRMQGFFHSTGHGLGLDIHEEPRLGVGEDILKEGHVVTVEPGLYYKKIGGVRLEDVALVTKKGCVNLTRFPRHLEI